MRKLFIVLLSLFLFNTQSIAKEIKIFHPIYDVNSMGLASIRCSNYYICEKIYNNKKLDDLGIEQYTTFIMATFYFNNKEYEKSLNLHKKLAKKGFELSINELATIYFHGIIVKKDVQKGMYYYKELAKLGHKDVVTYIVEIYSKGLNGVKKDVVKAYIWQKINIKRNDANQQKLYDLRAKMKPDQINKAEKLATEWLNKN